MAIRRIVAVIIFVVLIFPCGLAALYALSVASWALNRDFYVDILDDPALYEAFLNEGLPAALKDSATAPMSGQDDAVVEAYALAFREIATPDYLRNEILRLTNETFDFLESPSETLLLAVNVVPLKERITGEDRGDFANVLAANLPVCAASQQSMDAASRLLVCRPSDLSVTAMAEEIKTAIPAFVESLPDELPLGNPNNRDESLDLAGIVLPAVFSGSILGFAALIVLGWVVTALIGGGSRRGIFVWLGWMLFIPALMVLLSGLFAAQPLADMIANTASAEIDFGSANPTPQLAAAFQNAAGEGIGIIGRSLLATGGIALGVAFLMLGMGWASPRPVREDDDGDSYAKPRWA